LALRSISAYAREIRPRLTPGAFAPARSRLLWLPVQLTVSALCITAIARAWLPWQVWPVLSLVLGMSFAGLTFLGHETLHGAIVRGRTLRCVVGWVGFLPFAVSPTLWTAWHNRTHHGNTNHPPVDPDAYPTLEQYSQSRVVRVMTDAMAPGRGRLGILSFLIGFSVQSAHMLFAAPGLGMLSRKQHLRALAETALAAGVWAALAWVVGPWAFLFCFALPLLVANSIVMGFILTNHSLSPLTDVNDALVNSLTVTTPRLVEWLTLGFGYHVEHHLFPAMSTRHAPELRKVLLSLWPERYQSLPLGTALRELRRSPRVYKDETTLVDPHTGREWPALAPRALVKQVAAGSKTRRSERPWTVAGAFGRKP
jgi:fatty acid desaturase